MTKFPIIIDDLFDKDLQDQIEDIMFDCFWMYFLDNSLGSKTSEMKYRKFLSPVEYDITPSFIANLKSQQNKKIYDKIIPLIQKSCDEINFNIHKVKRCYGAIHALIRNNSKHDTIHINGDVPHLVMLYYVNDCDGDTILYDKTIDDIPYRLDYVDYANNNTFKIKHKITPKKGRVLFFDGRVYHAPSAPTKSMRCIITLDLFGEFMDGSYKFPAPKEKEKNTFKYQ